MVGQQTREMRRRHWSLLDDLAKATAQGKCIVDMDGVGILRRLRKQDNRLARRTRYADLEKYVADFHGAPRLIKRVTSRTASTPDWAWW